MLSPTLKKKAKYPISFTQPNIRFALRLQYNGNNNFLFAAKIYQFKAKISEIKDYKRFYN